MHVFHISDLRRIAPLWLLFTERVRRFSCEEPLRYFKLASPDEAGDLKDITNRRRQFMWMVEMYGKASTIKSEHNHLVAILAPFLNSVPVVLSALLWPSSFCCCRDCLPFPYQDMCSAPRRLVSRSTLSQKTLCTMWAWGYSHRDPTSSTMA